MEVTKFWTKTKIIILLVVLVIIGIIVGIYLFNRSKLKKEYMKLERQFTNATYNYLMLEKIELKKNEYRRIDIKKIVNDKLVLNKRADDCIGYVIAEKVSGKSKYKTYIKCKNIYQTPNYGKTTTTTVHKTENKTKTQTEKDTIKPVITLLGDKTITIGVGDNFKDPGATAMDNIDGNITKKIKIDENVDPTTAGTYTVKYSVKDKSGNKAVAVRKVLVRAEKEEKIEKDINVPVITFKNNDSVQKICVGDKVDISKDGIYGYSAYDDVDGDITKNVKVSGLTIAATAEGSYTLTYSVKDKAGNEAKTTKEYTVVNCNIEEDDDVDIIPTGVSCLDNITVGLGQSVNVSASVEPSNATNKKLYYSSTNNSIATIDSNGNIKGVSVGQVKMIISTYNEKSKIITVTVQ